MTFVTQVANSTEWNDTRPRRDPTSKAKTMLDAAGPETPGQKAENAGQIGSYLAPARRSAVLNRFVEAEILPRLALSRAKGAVRKIDVGPPAPTTEQDTTELVRLLMGREDGVARAFVEGLEQHGATAASLYLGVVTAAARRLGELWEDDRADFTIVTIGLGRLQQIVRALSPGFQESAVGRSGHADTALLLPAPGEQHTLGLVILSEFFQREGWHVLGGPVSTGQDAAAIVRDNLVDVAGFSMGSINHLDDLTAGIRAVRNASRNRYLAVMVGGPLFLQHPELVRRGGADSTAGDALSAVRQARGFLAMRAAAD